MASVFLRQHSREGQTDSPIKELCICAEEHIDRFRGHHGKRYLLTPLKF